MNKLQPERRKAIFVAGLWLCAGLARTDAVAQEGSATAGSKASHAFVGARSCISLRDLSLVPGTPEATRQQKIKKAGPGLSGLINWLYKQGVEQNIKDSIASLLPRIENVLDWSGEEGVLIGIVLEQDNLMLQPPRLVRVDIVGAGACPVNVIIEESAKRNELKADITHGYHFEPDLSSLVWIVHKGGKLEQHVVPVSFGRMVDLALADTTAAEALKKDSPQRQARRILAIAQEALRLTQDAEGRKAIAEAAAAIKDNEAKRGAIEANLQKAIEEQNRIASAVAWIGSFEKILTAAQLASQVQSMLGPTLPPAVGADIRLALAPHLTNEEALSKLKGTLTVYSNSSQLITVTRQNAVDVLRSSYVEKKKIIVDGAASKNAPIQLIHP